MNEKTFNNIIDVLLLMFSFYKSNAQDLFFGEYKKPELLVNLEEYQTKGGSWEYLGFYIDYDHYYSMTPLDVIPFAGTGGDGIHFGFLTDFGNQKDLENSPIVCISPSNDPPVKLVANNLQDFLSIVTVIGEAEFLDEDYRSEEEVETRLKEWDEISGIDWQGNPLPQSEIDESKRKLNQTLEGRRKLTELIKKDFGLNPVDSVVSYIQKIRTERIKKISLKDSYDIGIQYDCHDSQIKEFDYDNREISKIKNFLDGACKCERIHFYRNATYHYILSEDYDKEIKNCLIDFLKKDGFERELKVLKEKYK